MPDPFDPAAVRAAYDDVRTLLARRGGGDPVADVGCGPGHVTAHLRRLGLDVFGIDLSPATAPATLPAAFAALRRALAPGGQLIVAFQVGDGASVREEAFGRPISLALPPLAPRRDR